MKGKTIPLDQGKGSEGSWGTRERTLWLGENPSVERLTVYKCIYLSYIVTSQSCMWIWGWSLVVWCGNLVYNWANNRASQVNIVMLCRTSCFSRIPFYKSTQSCYAKPVASQELLSTHSVIRLFTQVPWPQVAIRIIVSFFLNSLIIWVKR